ncbi:glutamate--tRNA ligase, partial [Candidatus Saccharibacteria bacterium]|nr:glutamate--tRNA ligase [Candidatus Saccharibacteria bacterium]
DPYTEEEVDGFREKAELAGKAFLFREYRPETFGVWDGTKPLRFKVPIIKSYHWHDEVYGDLSAGPEALDDFILIKSDGYPTYNFCHIIDDMLMGITHILRSQEFISSTPKFLNLYEALNIERPVIATLPYVMAIDGKKKLGKRDGAKDILQYASDGYLPEAMINFLATLGWNDGSEQEIFSVQELIDKFTLDKVQSSPARFDEKRLLWINGQWIRKLSLDDLYERSANFWSEPAKGIDENAKKQVLSIVQERIKTLADLPMLTDYFFVEPAPNWQMIADDRQLGTVTTDEVVALLRTAQEVLKSSKFDPDSLQETLNTLLETTGQKPSVLFSAIRLAVSWAPFSPALNETLSVLGPDTTQKRLQLAIDTAK